MRQDTIGKRQFLDQIGHFIGHSFPLVIAASASRLS
jgi:hypothetical protein